MPSLWLINQFANTPELPGHTRQFEVAAGLVSKGWQVNMFASDFNLTQRKYRHLRFPQLWCNQRLAGIRWTWLWVSPYSQNNWKRLLNMLSFCFHLALRLGPAAMLGRLTGRAPDVILASSPQLPAAFTCLWIARLLRIPFVLRCGTLAPGAHDQGVKSQGSPLVLLLAWMESLHPMLPLWWCWLKVQSLLYVNVVPRKRQLPNGPDLDLFAPRPLLRPFCLHSDLCRCTWSCQ